MPISAILCNVIYITGVRFVPAEGSFPLTSTDLWNKDSVSIIIQNTFHTIC